MDREPPVTRVFVVARGAAGRTALGRRLEGPDLEVIGTGATPDGAPPGTDVLVLGDEELLVGDPAAPAVVVLADDGARLLPVLRRLRAHGWAVVSRDAPAAELRAAVAAAAQGLAAFPAGLTARQATEPEPLTARERDVLELLGQGLSNRRIAGRLAISEHTAKFHVASVLAKLGVSSRTEAVSLGLRRGLITL
jgi:DNA-binding NarL/FixJ family response regulator